MSRGVTIEKTPAQLVWKRFLRHKLAVSSALALLVLASAALLAPVFGNISADIG